MDQLSNWPLETALYSNLNQTQSIFQSYFNHISTIITMFAPKQKRVKQSSFPGLEQLSQGSEPEHRQWIGYPYPSEGEETESKSPIHHSMNPSVFNILKILKAHWMVHWLEFLGFRGSPATVFSSDLSGFFAHDAAPLSRTLLRPDDERRQGIG